MQHIPYCTEETLYAAISPKEWWHVAKIHSITKQYFVENPAHGKTGSKGQGLQELG